MDQIRIGIIGLGANTRLRHVLGLLANDGVKIAAVCNRRAESTRTAAAEFGIGKTFDSWQDQVADDEIDAIVIGTWPTWPYLHCEITLAALAAGKHVLTEARMAMNAAEARQMLAASQPRPAARRSAVRRTAATAQSAATARVTTSSRSADADPFWDGNDESGAAQGRG
jgi:predicted dehydrogenase